MDLAKNPNDACPLGFPTRKKGLSPRGGGKIDAVHRRIVRNIHRADFSPSGGTRPIFPVGNPKGLSRKLHHTSYKLTTFQFGSATQQCQVGAWRTSQSRQNVGDVILVLDACWDFLSDAPRFRSLRPLPKTCRERTKTATG